MGFASTATGNRVGWCNGIIVDLFSSGSSLILSRVTGYTVYFHGFPPSLKAEAEIVILKRQGLVILKRQGQPT